MTDTVAIVTGASSGIGRATAERLAKDFQAMVLVGQNAEQLNTTAREVGTRGAQTLVVPCDLSLPPAAREVIDATIKRFGRIDALINIAGAVPGLDVFDMTDGQWDAGMALKFHAARRLAVCAWPELKKSSGSVIFTSGTAAENPKAAQAAVAAINAAIEALSKAFAERGIQDGIQVNTVSPGAVITARRLGMLEKAANAKGIGLQEMKTLFLKSAGISRFGEASEVAALIGFLVSPAARWMTGSTLRIDGGEVKSI